MSKTREALNQLVRAEWGRMVAALARTTRGDLVVAEDALQTALVAAVRQWPVQGVPDSPVGWLLRTARFKAIDQLRREATWTRKQADLALIEEEAHMPELDRPAVRDDQLRLVFTCCHPALPVEARLALTLKTVAGLTTPELARAFLVDPRTMAQRVVRAKRRLQEAGIPYEVPAASELPERIDGVLSVVYLVFTEGYSATSGPGLLRSDLSLEALRLAAELVVLLPEEAEVHGLLALICFQDARRPARVDQSGDLVLLEDQDRRLWDQARIAQGLAALGVAVSLGPPGRFTLQAAIASVHCQSATWAETNHREIRLLYSLLRQVWDSPVVRLNEAVSIALSEGWEAGLSALEALEGDPHLERGHLLPAARADLLRRLERHEEAARHYRRALEVVGNEAERRFLERRLVEVEHRHRCQVFPVTQ